MVLYYKNILLQLKIITEKLRQVEDGDFTSQIEVLPDNEFSYGSSSSSIRWYPESAIWYCPR